MTTPQLATRKPTGKVAFPLILLEGVEKAGKTYAALSLSNSDRVGRTFVLELDEPTADEYASIGDFDILEHNGTFSSILGQLQAACAVPTEEGKPNVIVLDTGTALWNLLKDWAAHRARNSKRARQLLANDPDAEIDVSMNYWNDAKDRWYQVLNLLRSWPGIGIIVARGKEVAKVVNGQPVAGQTDWSTEVEKSTPFAVSATVRMTRPHTATLMSARSVHVDVPGRGIVLDESAPLEHLVFNVLGAGGDFQVSSAVVGSLGMPVATAKTRLVTIFERVVDNARAVKEASALWKESAPKQVDEINDEQWKALAGLAADRIVELQQEKEEGSSEAVPAPTTADEQGVNLFGEEDN